MQTHIKPINIQQEQQQKTIARVNLWVRSLTRARTSTRAQTYRRGGERENEYAYKQ